MTAQQSTCYVPGEYICRSLHRGYYQHYLIYDMDCSPFMC